MMRSLFSGVTGLRNHQTRMDVIGNNIANVNTVGFKASRVVFQDVYSQTLRPAAAPGATNGGTNPQQIGLGMNIATIDVLNTRTASQYTGSTMDLCVEGDGYFVLSGGGRLSYTRAGNFYTDNNNNLVSANGEFVQGFKINADQSVDKTVMGNIQIDPSFYNITIDSNGTVTGIDNTDNKKVIGQLALATFVNQNALEKAGSNAYYSSANSGQPVFNLPGDAGAGSLNPGALEMSNVDLAKEFTDMIITQRGFQANSRVITTTDQMLEELVNLKR